MPNGMGKTHFSLFQNSSHLSNNHLTKTDEVSPKLVWKSYVQSSCRDRKRNQSTHEALILNYFPYASTFICFVPNTFGFVLSSDNSEAGLLTNQALLASDFNVPRSIHKAAIALWDDSWGQS
ncbi:hypothetical protein YC2023_035947 [Brassica napus]